MAEYTPKVWDDNVIREAFIDDGGLSEYHDPINGAQTHRRVMGDIFDRWLAAHDREVTANALREFAKKVYNGAPANREANFQAFYDDGLHPVLLREANRIESQANEKGVE